MPSDNNQSPNDLAGDNELHERELDILHRLQENKELNERELEVLHRMEDRYIELRNERPLDREEQDTLDEIRDGIEENERKQFPDGNGSPDRARD